MLLHIYTVVLATSKELFDRTISAQVKRSYLVSRVVSRVVSSLSYLVSRVVPRVESPLSYLVEERGASFQYVTYTSNASN